MNLAPSNLVRTDFALPKNIKPRAARAKGVPSLEPPLPLKLLRAREALMQLFRPHMRELGLTDQQGRILRVLAERDAVELSELSAETCIHPASLSRMIPRMQANGVLRRWRDPVDARRVMVSISKPGMALFRAIARQSLDIYATVAREIGPTRLKELNRSLDSLIAGIGKSSGGAEQRRGRRIIRPGS